MTTAPEPKYAPIRRDRLRHEVQPDFDHQRGAGTYDSFGKLTASTGTLTNPFRYTAREFDSETGLYYYRARYYDPMLGRFMSEDPIDFEGGVNFFSYALNNPINFFDPTGTDARITQAGNMVTVSAVVVVHGDQATALAFYWNWAINRWWNNYGNQFQSGSCTVKFNITVLSAANYKQSRPRNAGPVNHVYARASSNYLRSFVRNHNTGYWWSDLDAWGAAHEAGHFFWLRDDYVRVRGGRAVPRPGHAGHMMGESYGSIAQHEIDDIVKRGRCVCQ